MSINKFVITLFWLMTPIILCCQPPKFLVSEILADSTARLYLKRLHLENRGESDTIFSEFEISNDLALDTFIYLLEWKNEYIHCSCEDISSGHNFVVIGGSSILKQNPVHVNGCQASILRFNAMGNYRCKLKILGIEFFGLNDLTFVSELKYYKTVLRKNIEYSRSETVDSIFLGIILFNIFLLLFLFIISKQKLLIWYILYLITLIVYGLYIIDIDSWVGSLYSEVFLYKSNISESLIFIGQIIYIYFIYLWLEMDQLEQKYILFVQSSMAAFFTYVIAINIYYAIDPRNYFIGYLMGIIRIVSLVIQFITFYILIFKVKSEMKIFVLLGSSSLIFFGVVMNMVNNFGLLKGYLIDILSSGAWFMIGCIFEVFFFSIGLGYYYNKLEKSNSQLAIDKLQAEKETLVAEEAKLKDRIRISQDLHDQIGSTLSSIAIYSEVAGKLEAFNNSGLNEVLDKIKDSANTATSDISDIVWAIHPKNDNFEKVLDRLQAFALPIAKSRGINFNLINNIKDRQYSLSMEQRKNIYLICKEAINNALKYSAAKNVNLIVNTINIDMIMIEIIDDGLGFDVDYYGNDFALSGNGIQNMRDRACSINAELRIESQSGSGTKVQIIS